METTPYLAIQSSANLVVLEDGVIRNVPLDLKKEWSFGRAVPGNTPDVQMHSNIVSRQHGRFFLLDGDWYYRDEGSYNGTWFNGEKLKRESDNKSRAVKLKNGDVIRIDSEDLEIPDDRGVWILFSTESLSNQWKSVYLRKKETVFGRDPEECDVCIPLPYVSARHVIFAKRADKYYVMDCDSMSGTWLNNQKVMGECLLHEKDHVAICDCLMVFTGNYVIYNVPKRKQEEPEPMETPVEKLAAEELPAVTAGSGEEITAEAAVSTDEAVWNNAPVIIKADIESKIVPNSNGHGNVELLRDVHVQVREGSLVALLGGSGAGKTTVMNCMNGMDTRGVKGNVEFQGVDLLRNFERMKFLIGSVPQREVFHETLSVEKELHDAAVIRLPKDTKRKEINAHVDRTIHQLGLDAVRKNRISTCSGGEKKRVNIAIELVADRQLLCLDEPDAALDPGMKRELFRILRDLAHKEGKSILVIIHDVSEIDLFDQIIMMAKVDNVGRLAFSGTPNEARKYFGREIKDAYELLKKEPEKYVH